jgi:S1-C subfamily serine protease
MMLRISGAAWLALPALLVAMGGVARGQTPAAGGDAVAAIQQAVVDAIARAEKSVVAIARVRRERPGETVEIEPRPEPFGGRRVIAVPPPRPSDPDFIPSEYAAGVVIDRTGLILTAFHVLGEESDCDYYVTHPNRVRYRARVVGADPRSDLAVLSPEEGALPRSGTIDFVPILLGDASALKKGQLVVALGNPYAIARDGQPSASWGIVANLNRKAPPVPDEDDPLGKSTIHHFGTLIQTDAKLNLGTSGGPLINLKGEMIGLATAIPVVAGYQEMAGYAIPVDATFRRALEALKQGREVEYGFLGIQLGGVAGERATRGAEGTRVERVMPGLPAARHGLKSGDLIVAVNGAPVRDSDQLVRQLSKLPLEAVVKLAVHRGEQKLDLEVPLTKYRVRGKPIVTTAAPAWRGMRVDYATAVQDAYSFSAAAGVPLGEAIAVTEVEKGTPAWDAGLRPGMLVSHVERTAVQTPKDFRNAVSKKSGPVELRVAGQSGEPVARTVRPGT